MAQKTTYPHKVDPQVVDFTLRATVPALTNAILNVAGIDAQTKGFGVDALRADNVSWVLSRMALEFDSRPEEFSEYTVTTWISDYNRLVSTRNFTLNDAEGHEFGRAVTQWCLFDLTERRALDLTARGDLYASAVVDAPSPAERPRRLRPVAPVTVSEHRVVYSDIDFNRHVNTLRYLDMMFDTLPIESFVEDRPLRIDVHFLSECRYGQTLRIGSAPTPAGLAFEISAADTATPAVRAAFEWK